jgi:acetylornithine deacetylase/succinyl-diaminopimelate desuccinylase-like protein
VVPKVSVNAVRSGVPYKITRTPAICHLYLDIRIAPDQSLLSVERELRAAVERTGIPARVEPFVFRRGYEAVGVEPLVARVEAAHRLVFGKPPGRPVEAVTSMWRDSNVFNEAGIPTVIYGPGASVGGGNFAMEVRALIQAAKVYAAIAIEVCGVEQAT